jgi:hypothetical protein
LVELLDAGVHEVVVGLMRQNDDNAYDFDQRERDQQRYHARSDAAGKALRDPQLHMECMNVLSALMNGRGGGEEANEAVRIVRRKVLATGCVPLIEKALQLAGNGTGANAGMRRAATACLRHLRPAATAATAAAAAGGAVV